MAELPNRLWAKGKAPASSTPPTKSNPSKERSQNLRKLLHNAIDERQDLYEQITTLRHEWLDITKVRSASLDSQTPSFANTRHGSGTINLNQRKVDIERKLRETFAECRELIARMKEWVAELVNNEEDQMEVDEWKDKIKDFEGTMRIKDVILDKVMLGTDTLWTRGKSDD